MKRMLSKAILLEKLEMISNPKKHNLTQQSLEQTLIDFCAGCPDPIKARWLVAECLEPMTDDNLVERALNMPIRPMSEVPTSIVPANHPARASA